jgi:CBS domain containing-hemolysin-like protein
MLRREAADVVDELLEFGELVAREVMVPRVRIRGLEVGAPLDSVLDAMHRANAQLAVVMDEHGGTDGIMTTEDLFEEVIGDIQDPASEAPPELYVAADGSQRAADTARIEDLGEEIGRPLQHEDVDTVSGLVLSLLDRPPRVGDRVRYDGIELYVLEVTGRGVGECRVTLVEGEAGGDAGQDPGGSARVGEDD